MRKIVVWGTGKSSKDFTKGLVNTEIVAYIDNFSDGDYFEGKPVYKLEQFLEMNIDFERLVVASIYSNEIFNQCQGNLDINKVIFLFPLGQSSQVNNITFAEYNISFLQEIAPNYIEDWIKRTDLEMEEKLPDNEVYKNWKRNIKFKDIHRGKRCFILGNGPSLSEIDLQKLENEIVFTTNFFNKVEGYEKVHTNYHFWIDAALFNQRSDTKCEMDELMNCYHAISKEKPVCFVPFLAVDFIKQYKLSDSLDFHYLRIGKQMDESFKGEFELSSWIPAWRNVIQYAIVTAIYMGFKDIYLLGCNATCIIPILDLALEQDISQMHVYRDDTTDNKMKNILQNWSMLFGT